MACWLLLALGLLGASRCAVAKAPQAQKKPAAGQAAAQDPGAFVDMVNVSVVNVDVYVTDKKGNPVTGLTKDDFQLFENGKPVEITNFYAVKDGKATAQPSDLARRRPRRAGPGAAPASSRPDLDQVRTPEDQRLRLIVYIDNYNLQPFNRNRVMRELRAFIGDQARPRTTSSCWSPTTASCTSASTFTSDPER